MDVLLIRGLGREARHWGDFGQRLQARRPELRPVALDPPGVGTERHRPSPLRLSRMVDDMRTRWRPTSDLRVVFGISLGGMLALKWAARHPDDVDYVVVANTSAANLGLPHQRILPKGLSTVIRSMRQPDHLSRERQVLELICNHPERRDEVAEPWAALAADGGVPRGAVVRQIAAGALYRAPRQLRQPLLVLSCPGDRFVDPGCSERLAARLGARHERHPTAGHALSVDAPDWTADRIVEWLGDLGH